MEIKEASKEVVIGGKKSNALIYIGALIIVVFVSATFGGIFGFLASRSNGDIFKNLKNGKLENIFSGNDEMKKEIMKQEIIQEDSAVIDVVKKASPAVVSIVVTRDIPARRSMDLYRDFFDDPFNFFWEDEGGERRTVGGGTGFFITSDGLIVTNKHVVEDERAEFMVVANDDKEYPAKVLARDPLKDVAIIKIEGKDFPTLDLGDSSAILVGQTVVAIGNSLGQFSNTVSRGIISGLKRDLTAGDGLGQTEKLNDIIQTDAAINPGNSGGPLLDIGGKVIGVNVAIAQGAQNVGFAIPANQIKKVVEQVKKTGRISTPYVGVRYIPIDEKLKEEFNLPFDYGNLIIRGDGRTDLAVIPGSPADKAGLVENDIILEIDGKKLSQGKNGKNLSEIIADYNVGDTLNLKVWHKGETKEIKVKLEERK